MFKCMIGFFAGTILTGALFMGPFSLTPVIGQSEDPCAVKTLPNIANTFHDGLTAPMQQAGEEITDHGTGQLYQKLLREYELDESFHEMTQAEHSKPTAVLPDIKKINNAAITLPLEEAGKNIQDEDIAQFYYKFLESTGLAIESE